MNTPVILTDADRLTLEAAKRLIQETKIEDYQKSIWEMFECWIGSDLTDGTSNYDRATVWFACKWLNEFFESVKKVS